MSAYIIQQDDTLFTIAEDHTGNGNRYEEILPLNPQITDPDLIIEGAMIQLPDSWTSQATSNLPAVIPSVHPSSPAAPTITAPAPATVKADTILSGTLLALIIGGGLLLYWKKPEFFGLALANPEEGETEAEDTEAEDYEEEDYEAEDQED